MPQHFKVHELLTRDELDKLESFAREPGRTVDECWEWMQAKGYTLSRSAVGGWLQRFRLEDRAHKASETARAYLDVARAADPVAVSQASLGKFQELVFEHLVSTDETDAGELMKIAVALKTSLNAQQVANDLRRQQADAVKAAEQQAKSGASAADVVTTIKKALGIAA